MHGLTSTSSVQRKPVSRVLGSAVPPFSGFPWRIGAAAFDSGVVGEGFAGVAAVAAVLAAAGARLADGTGRFRSLLKLHCAFVTDLSIVAADVRASAILGAAGSFAHAHVLS